MSETTTETQRPITISSRIKTADRYRKFLQVTSLFLKLPITPTEISILDGFYHASDGQITTASRRQVRERLNMSPEQLNNYIRILRSKKVILGDSFGPMFLFMIPKGKQMRIEIKLDLVI